MIDTAEIFLWGTRIGIIHKDQDVPYSSFEYDKDFLNSGIELSPIVMPLSDQVYEFPALADSTFHGLPGLVSDSLPDKFGNSVISRWLSSIGRTDNDFSAIDRLCYTGSRGMGALEYVPSIGPDPDPLDQINMTEMAAFANSILEQRSSVSLSIDDNPAYSQLLKVGTSAGGARAKAVVAWNEKTNEIRSGQVDLGKEYSYWIIKFDGITENSDHGIKDQPEYTLIEYAYYLMARKAGIIMSDCKLFSESGHSHFMTRRFDRTESGKLHMQTLGAICHSSYNEPGMISYEQAASYMRQMSLPASDIEQLYRRMVFNVFAVNQDDHVKNISFLMDKSGKWHLSPAYDITFAYNSDSRWLSRHQMLINNKASDITEDDLLCSARAMDISTKKAKNIITEVKKAVSQWCDIANEVGISAMYIDAIDRLIYPSSS